MDTQKITARFCGVTINGNPMFDGESGLYCVVDEFLTCQDDMREIAETVRLINAGELTLHIMSGPPGEQEVSHPVFNIKAAMPRGNTKVKPKTPKETGPLYTTEDLAALVIRDSSMIKYKEVSGKFKEEKYLYRVVKRGRTLDLTSASFIHQTYQQVNPETKEKLLKLPLHKLMELIYRCS